MPDFVTPADVQPGNLVDLQGHDLSPENDQIWEFELAQVQAVSTEAARSGGWMDGLVEPGQAIIYTVNGATPSVVPLNAVLNRSLQGISVEEDPDAS